VLVGESKSHYRDGNFFPADFFKSKYSEMQREIEELRWKLRRATQGALPIPRQDPSIRSAAEDESGVARATSNRELGHFTVSGELLDDLFRQYGDDFPMRRDNAY
jgi:hypothetical protein